MEFPQTLSFLPTIFFSGQWYSSKCNYFKQWFSGYKQFGFSMENDFKSWFNWTNAADNI